MALIETMPADVHAPHTTGRTGQLDLGRVNTKQISASRPERKGLLRSADQLDAVPGFAISAQGCLLTIPDRILDRCLDRASPRLADAKATGAAVSECEPCAKVWACMCSRGLPASLAMHPACAVIAGAITGCFARTVGPLSPQSIDRGVCSDPAKTHQSKPRLVKNLPESGNGFDRKPLPGHANTYVDSPSSKPARKPRALVVAATVTIIAASGILAYVHLEHGKHHSLGKRPQEERRPAKSELVVPGLDLIDSETLGYRGCGDSTTPFKMAPAVQPSHSRTLRVRGSLAIDPNRLIHVHVRFPGQIVEFGTTSGLSGPRRPLSTLDPVTKGQRIGVIWSKDYGEKKSELVDALARLRLDRQTLTRLEKLAETGECSAGVRRR